MIIKGLILITLIFSSGSKAFGYELEDKIKQINILMPAPFADSTNELIKDFNKINKNELKVSITRGPMDTESVSDLAISSLLLGENPYDALLIDVTWLPKFAAAGWLTPLDNWIKTKRWNQLHEGARLGNKFKNKIYRWPLVADMGLLYWRKDLIKEPPKTFNQLKAISNNLQKEKKIKYGYVWQGRQYEGLSCVFLEVLKGNGGEWLNKDGTVELNSPESIASVKWLLDLIESEVSPRSVTNFSENETLQVFKSGDAAFMRNWPYAWSELQKDNSNVKGKVGVTVMVSKNGELATSTLGSWGFSILKDSKHKEETMKVIEYLTKEESQIKMFLKYGYTPISESVYKNNELNLQYPILKALKKGLNAIHPRPQTPIYAQLSDVLQRQISSILTKQVGLEEGLSKAQINSNIILNSSGEK
tara:strand:+ start:343 stop:1599 length:1257 start_codon:yes stop_codon:yes gene_type:complete